MQLAFLGLDSRIRDYLPDWLTHYTAVTILVAAAVGNYMDKSTKKDK